MKQLNLSGLTRVQLEILKGLILRALYDFDEMELEEQAIANESAGYDVKDTLVGLKRWLTFNS